MHKKEQKRNNSHIICRTASLSGNDCILSKVRQLTFSTDKVTLMIKPKQNLSKYLTQSILDTARALRHTSRRILAEWRALPDFIIIGAQRAGTTSLYAYVTRHPQVLNSSKKEVHYFDINYQKSDLWYRTHFPLVNSLKNGAYITGEASPSYLFHPQCPERIRDRIPKVKFIVLLRNPVDRAISHYFHEVRNKRESLSIKEALKKEEERMSRECQKMLKDPNYDGFAYRHFSYKNRGIYVDQLRRYLQIFPSNQMLILRAEDLFSDPQKVMRDVYAYLNINTAFSPSDLKPRHAGSYTREVPNDVYDCLRDYFRPHNERLCTFLGRNFGW